MLTRYNACERESKPPASLVLASRGSFQHDRPSTNLEEPDRVPGQITIVMPA